jgi:O-antigen/teichoic acid export membrane protein
MIHDTLKVLGSNLAVNLSSFLVLALAARILSVEEFAKLSLIVASSLLGSGVLDLGINVGAVKKYAETKDGRFLATLVGLKLAVSAGCLGLFTVCYGIGVPSFWLIILVSAASVNLWTGARALEQARLQFSRLAQANVLFAALRIILGIMGLAAGNAITLALAFFVGPPLAMAAYKWRGTAALIERFDWGPALEVLRYAVPAYISATLYGISIYYPQFVVAQRLDATAVSTFGVLLTYLGPLALFNGSTRFYLLPRVVGKDLKRVDVLGNQRAMALIGGTLVLGLLAIAGGAVLVEKIYGTNYPGVGFPFWIYISLYLVISYLGFFNLDVHRMGKIAAEAQVNAARLAVLVAVLWLFGDNLRSIVVFSGLTMLAGEWVLFVFIGRLARREATLAKLQTSALLADSNASTSENYS